MDLQLAGKRALVTGSTAGIGYAIACALAQEGASVIITGRTQPRVDDALRRLQEEVRGAPITGVAADLGVRDGIAHCLRAVPDIDILVNNLGHYEVKPFDQISDDDWSRIIEVNFMSGVRLSRHYLPPMKQRNWGRIIFISSESGVNIPVEMIHYGVTKTMQLALSRGLAETTASTGVTVNAVLPGPTRSEGLKAFVGQIAKSQNMSVAQVEGEVFKTARPSSLLQRLATPEEVASLVAYVASPLSSATNGAALRVDGGVVRSIV